MRSTKAFQKLEDNETGAKPLTPTNKWILRVLGYDDVDKFDTSLQNFSSFISNNEGENSEDDIIPPSQPSTSRIMTSQIRRKRGPSSIDLTVLECEDDKAKKRKMNGKFKNFIYRILRL